MVLGMVAKINHLSGPVPRCHCQSFGQRSCTSLRSPFPSDPRLLAPGNPGSWHHTNVRRFHGERDMLCSEPPCPGNGWIRNLDRRKNREALFHGSEIKKYETKNNLEKQIYERGLFSRKETYTNYWIGYNFGSVIRNGSSFPGMKCKQIFRATYVKDNHEMFLVLKNLVKKLGQTNPEIPDSKVKPKTGTNLWTFRWTWTW